MKTDISKIKNKNVLLVAPPIVCVDKLQVINYPDMMPTGLLQIGSILKENGCSVKLINMASPSVYSPIDYTYFRDECAGSDNGIKLKTYIFGKNLDFLRDKLKEIFNPDIIFVSCSITYNYKLVFEVIKICKRYFPDSHLILGGNYPSTNPNHAKKSLADEIYIGAVPNIELYNPDLTLLEHVNYLVFRFVTGCKNKCSFCINGKQVLNQYDIDRVIHFIDRSNKKYKLNHISNWDPNVLSNKGRFIEFLKTLKGFNKIHTNYEMGLQPNLVDESLLKLMKDANVTHFSIPFEASMTKDFKRLEKPFTIISSIKVLSLAKKYNFLINHSHCCFIIGYPEDDIKNIMRTFCTIIFLGGHPTPFPITVIPGTKAYSEYYDIVKDKDFAECNGALWPLIKSKYIPYYKRFLYFLQSENLETAKERMKYLSKNDRELFLNEIEAIPKFVDLCLNLDDNFNNLDKANEEFDKLKR